MLVYILKKKCCFLWRAWCLSLRKKKFPIYKTLYFAWIVNSQCYKIHSKIFELTHMHWKGHSLVKVSISPTFYVRLFSYESCTYILGLNFFWRKNYGANVVIKYRWNWHQLFSTAWCQFHLQSKSRFWANILVPKKFKPKMSVQKNCCKKMLLKLTGRSCTGNLTVFGY